MTAEHWKEIIIALLENNLWPSIVVCIVSLAVIFRKPIGGLITRAASVRYKDFLLSIKDDSERGDFETALNYIREVTATQLHIFLIIGGENGANLKMEYPCPGSMFEEAMKKLQDLKLITFEKDEQSRFQFGPTSEGQRLHKAILDEIYMRMTRG